MCLNDELRKVEFQNRIEAQNIKVQEIVEVLIKKTNQNDIYWEKSGEDDCYILEVESGTFVIARYVKNIGKENRRFIGFRLVSNSNVVFFENEVSDDAKEFEMLDNFYEKIEDATINNFLDSVLENVNDFPDTIEDDENLDLADI